MVFGLILPAAAAPGGSAHVDDDKGWYLTVGAGSVWPNDVAYSVRNEDNYGRFRFAPGLSVDGGLGYDFGSIRAEITYNYSSPSLESVYSTSFGQRYDASGRVSKNDVLASVYWDVWKFGRFTPYLGGGVGYTNLILPGEMIDDYRIPATCFGGLGWQALAGLEFRLSPYWDVVAEG